MLINRLVRMDSHLENPKKENSLKTTIVTIAEGKRDFSKLINEAVRKDEHIVVTRRGKPVAVIMPYERYLRSRRIEAYQKILKARTAFVGAGVSAETVYKESRRDLERRG